MSPVASAPRASGTAGILALIALTAPEPSLAWQDGGPPARSLHVVAVEEGEIHLDGRLVEGPWQRAPLATGFTQREPNDGTPGSERTEVRVLYSSRAVYIGVRALDSRADLIRSQLVRRDGEAQCDQIWIYLDSFHDHLTSYQFGVTPRGSIMDLAAAGDNSWGDASWDPVWDVATAVDSAGWTAEFRVPFAQLRFNQANTVWGFQVKRRIERNAEEVWWAPYSKEGSGFASRFGDLEGFVGLPAPMRLEVRPYTVGSSRWRPREDGSGYAPGQQWRGSSGVDLKYGLTPDFTLDLTANPDFGQVEADPAVVNLTAFESYFPERRPFFVEGAGLFDRYVPGGQAFYSRRIGRPPRGSASPPDGGSVETPEQSTIAAALKVTGKTAGGLGLGIMSATTTPEHATLRDSLGVVSGTERVAPLTHAFAARVEQSLRGGSQTVGGMVTALNRRLGDGFDFLPRAEYVGMLDGRHRWQRNTYEVSWRLAGSYLRGPAEAMIAAQRSPLRYFQRPDAPHVAVDSNRTSLTGHALSLDVGRQAGTWRYYLGYQRVSPGLDVNELGFQWSGDSHGGYGGLSFVRSRPVAIFRSFRLSVDGSSFWTTAGEHTGVWFRPVWFYATFKNNWTLSLNPLALEGDRFSVSALRGGPGLRQNAWRNSWVWLSTDTRRPIRLYLWANVGSVVGTSQRWAELSPELTFRPAGNVNASLEVAYSWSRDPEQWVGRRTVDDSTHYLLGQIERQTLNVTARAGWTLLPTLSVELFMQPYVSAGRYRAFKEAAAPGAGRYQDRFRAFGSELSCSGGECEVDLDLDGTVEFSFDQPDFNYRSLRSTTVLRWEYRPGSVLFVAWQHGRWDERSDGTFGGFRDVADLRHLPSDNTVLVKLSYWIGL